MGTDPANAEEGAAGGDVGGQAAAWLARRDRGMSAAEKLAFQRWLEGAENATAYVQLEEAWREFDQVKAVPDLAEMARQLDEDTRGRRPRPAAAGSWLGAMAAVAAVAAVTIAGWRLERAPAVPPAAVPAARQAYRVVPSAARRMVLADGSVVDLRSDSEVQTDFTPEFRRVTLRRGEAHFEVAKNPGRPFVVRAGSLTVRDIGTIFDVQLGAAQVNVLVTEGKVTVEDSNRPQLPAVPLLVAGQRAIISEEVGAPRVVVDRPTAAEIEQALAWQSTWLVFDRTTLADAAAAFNRQNAQQLVLGDGALRGRRLDGMFRADNVDGFVRLLKESLDVRSEPRGENEIVLLPAR
jgi:transmembrane sensor